MEEIVAEVARLYVVQIALLRVLLNVPRIVLLAAKVIAQGCVLPHVISHVKGRALQAVVLVVEIIVEVLVVPLVEVCVVEAVQEQWLFFDLANENR